MDLGAWLRGLGLGQYEPMFREHGIDPEVLPHLTADDLKDMGVAAIGHRRKLLAAIAALGEGASLPETRSARPEPASSITGLPPARTSREAERRQLTVMFVDLVGSTALSRRLDPEELGVVIRAYQDTVAGEIGRFEGHVAKFLGDGVLAYFGWPRAHEDAAERAVRAGLAVTEAVGRLTAPHGEPLAARVGIATGLVVVGDLVGEGAAREEAVLGETPNLAARLQQLAEPGTVVVAEATRRLLGTLFELADLGPTEVKGFAAPVRGFRVIGEGAAEGRFEALHGASTAPLVGRDRELALLLGRWRLARTGEGQVVLLSGEPGIGKSRLVLALRERLRSEDRVCLRYHGSPHHTNSALHPVVEQLARAAGFARGDDDAVRFAKLEALLARAVADVAEVTPFFAELLSLPTGGRFALPPLTPQEKKARTFRALLAQLEGLAARSPVLMVLEDAHWLDPTTLELFDLVVSRIERLPVLLVVTFRPEFRPPWTGHAHATALVLDRLGRAAVQAIVERLAAGKRLPEELVAEIVAKTDGVPLFIEELTKAVLESGFLKDEGDRYALTKPLPPLAVPATLWDSLTARLDRLVTAKEVAQIGAVIGREFPHELLAAVAPLPEDELREALDRLVDAELVFRGGAPPQATYTFKHALVQDAAYDTLLRGKRQQLHARIALVLEERFPEMAEVQPELLAHHLTAAGLAEKAATYWHKAGRRASERSALAEATAHLTKGLELIRSLPEAPDHAKQELALHLTLGPVLSARSWAAPEVEQTYFRARELCRRVGHPSELFTVTWGLWIVYAQRGQFRTARGLIEELVGLAERLSDPALLLQAHHAAWTTFDYQGELLLAREHAEQGIALYRPDEHRSHKFLYGGHDPGACSLNHLAFVLWSLGYPDQAVGRALDAMSLARAASHAFTLVVTQLHTMLLRQFRREPLLVREGADETIALGAEHGFAHHLAMGTILRGWALAAEGHAGEGLAEIRQGLAAVRATGTELRRSYYLALLAEACGWAGQVEHGLSALGEALAFVEETGERRWEAEIHRLKGELLARSTGSRVEAEACFRRAIEVARRQSARSLELRAATSLARLWREQGRRKEARGLLAPAYGWFTEGFDAPDLQEAKALLDELGCGRRGRSWDGAEHPAGEPTEPSPAGVADSPG